MRFFKILGLFFEELLDYRGRPFGELLEFLKEPNIFFREIAFPYLQMSIGQYDLLKKISGRNKLIVEIGSYKGGTSMRLARKNKIVAIDPFIGFWDKEDALAKEIGEERGKVIGTFKKNIRGKRVQWIEKKSEDAIKDWSKKIDILFIDGDHTYEGIKKDSQWIRFVKEGGFIAIHDVHYVCPGVEKFVKEEIVPKYQLVGKRGSLWVFRK